MTRARLVPLLLPLLALATSARPASARAVHAVCRDGVPPVRTGCLAGCVRPVRCDVDVACNRTCTYAIRVCGEVACVDDDVAVPVGERRTGSLSAPGGAPVRYALRCLAHPRRLPCPSTTTTTTTTSTTSEPPVPCPTTTTLGVPDCGGIPTLCGAPCRSGQACSDVGGGQCACTGPVLCGGFFNTCGGECSQGQTCAPIPVPTGCAGIGCTCE